jgi:hypothetical protein
MGRFGRMLQASPRQTITSIDRKQNEENEVNISISTKIMDPNPLVKIRIYTERHKSLRIHTRRSVF